jgi:hypothetical protein
MNDQNCKPQDGKVCAESAACALRLKLWTVALSLAFSFIMGVVGLLGRSEALVGAGLYAFYQAFVSGRSILSPDEDDPNAPSLWFVSLVAGFIIALGALDVAVFSAWRLLKASRGLLVDPSPLAVLAAAAGLVANAMLWHSSACPSSQPGGATLAALRRDFATAMGFCALAGFGAALGRLWPAADALAALIAAGLLVRPIMELCRKVRRSKKT